MKKNIGSIDRVIRVIIAVAFMVLYFNGMIEGTVGLILIGLSAIFLLTSLVGTCPIYLLLGISSLRNKMTTKNE